MPENQFTIPEARNVTLRFMLVSVISCCVHEIRKTRRAENLIITLIEVLTCMSMYSLTEQRCKGKKVFTGEPSADEAESWILPLGVISIIALSHYGEPLDSVFT